ncbi:Transposable element Tcb2 transposase [Anthophora plagiata]
MLKLYQRGLLVSVKHWFKRTRDHWILQEDNDPKHQNRLCTEWKTANGVNVLDWPSQSPDANPIENVLSLMNKACEFWKNFEGTEEYDEWENKHSDKCFANHNGSAGKMEVDSIVEMFKRSESLYNVRYDNYIGDGDSKTYKGIVDSNPYQDLVVKKKECIVVQKVIKPEYDRLTDTDLLERCIEGYTQNNNESLNAVIWSMAPKVHYSGAKIVEIASYIAASIFNDGYTSVLKIMQLLNLESGLSALQFSENLDSQRISIANIRAQQETKEARKLKRAAQKETEDITAIIEDLMYGPGIAD